MRYTSGSGIKFEQIRQNLTTAYRYIFDEPAEMSHFSEILKKEGRPCTGTINGSMIST